MRQRGAGARGLSRRAATAPPKATREGGGATAQTGQGPGGGPSRGPSRVKPLFARLPAAAAAAFASQHKLRLGEARQRDTGASPRRPPDRLTPATDYNGSGSIAAAPSPRRGRPRQRRASRAGRRHRRLHESRTMERHGEASDVYRYRRSGVHCSSFPCPDRCHSRLHQRPPQRPSETRLATRGRAARDRGAARKRRENAALRENRARPRRFAKTACLEGD